MYKIIIKHLGLPNDTVNTEEVVGVNKEDAHKILNKRYPLDQYKIVSEGKMK
ncbi:hypothetical protein AsAng_0013790 [Aureispira anguillae]|uniref:Uncharacterized protein n=1 Tax=Aureispira anguillae TaxID=2864201 RepID=A0A915YCQ2_9BACT|nr:hypothetical protein AsAng_0013730 [Aureispira anguillae]BDS10670.1 hypothetical protein AsAng_0013790 [Aureispira anguillae]